MKNIVDLTVGSCKGTDIAEATESACKIVYKLKIPVRFNFNDLSIWIEPKDSIGATFDIDT